MRLNDDWRCKVCDAPNHYAADVCSECHAPKVMRPIEVDAVRAARGGFSIPPEDEQELTRLRKVDRLAPSEQALHWAFVTPAVAILVLIKFGAWALISAFGFLGFIALAVFGVISSIIASSLSAPKDRQ